MPEFPRQKLTFKEKLGEGQFGEVHSVFFFATIDFMIRQVSLFLHLGLPDLFSLLLKNLDHSYYLEFSLEMRKTVKF